MLYLIPTPIGNLSDITIRALDVLKACDLILCEDTRHSSILLHHYNIHKPTKSYHKFNELHRVEELIEELKNGKNIALISDAGTPGIADPGYLLVQRCNQEKVPVTSLPGPCALITALTLSGFQTERFQFFGFLPKKEGQLQTTFIEMLCYPGTSVCYESPHRIVDTLTQLAPYSKERKIALARELSKKHEEVLRGTAQELLDHFKTHQPLGEMVLMLEGGPEMDYERTPQEDVLYYQQEFGLSQQEAIKLTAQLRNIQKRALYKLFIP